MYADPSGYIYDYEQEMYESGKMSPGAYSFLMVCTYYYYLSDTEEGRQWWNSQAQNFRDSGYIDTGNEYWNWTLTQMDSIPNDVVFTMTMEDHYFRNDLNIQFQWDEFQTLNSRLPNDLKWEEETLSKFHQNHTVNGKANVKYISSCGHFEMVFNGNNVLLTKSNNSDDMGTYNYYSPKSHPGQHTIYDIVPYMQYGNTYSPKREVYTL